MSNIIKPTVGRKVWYRPGVTDFGMHESMTVIDGQPLDATVVATHGDRCVNLVIFDAVGDKHVRHSVPLLQEGDAMDTISAGYAEWMPFQAKAAAREPALDALTAASHPLKAGIVPLDAQGVAITGSACGYLGKTAYSERPADTMTISTPPAPMV